MTHRLILVLALSAAAAPLGEAGIATGYYYVTARKSKPGELFYLAVKDSKLVLGAASSLQDERGSAPDRWHVLGTQIKSSAGGGYLAYDPSGKSKGIFLSPRPVKGAEWQVRRVYTKRSNHLRESMDYEWGVVEAASGPLKGWSLDVEEVGKKRGNGGTAPVRRLILSKRRAWNVEAGGIYEHK
jgi:hypothetical protein